MAVTDNSIAYAREAQSGDPSINPDYLTDASGYTGHAERLLLPRDEAELMSILAEAVATHTPITIAGAGTGLTGSRVAQGGWIVSMERFHKLEVHEGHALVGPAVRLMELTAAALPSGQFYAPDPTEISASIGGNIATNASGSKSFRYGATRRHVRALKVALLDGSVRWYRRGEPIDFDVPALPRPNVTKNTAGYQLAQGMDWVDLFVGSEGTLGIIVEAELSLLPLPKEIFAGVVFFAHDEAALDAVRAWRGVGELRMMEYADGPSLDMIRPRYPEIPAAANAALLIESEGSDLEAWYERLEAQSALTEASWFAQSDRDRERFRAFRHAMPQMVVETMTRRGFMNMGTDYSVPLDRDRDMLAFYRKRLEEELPGHYVIFGHIGDAHLHLNMLPATQEQAERASALLQEFAAYAVSLGGTVSAEHGLGKRKARLLALQYSPEEIDAMRAIKQRFDPHWLLGRGTLFAAPEDLA
jgi:FAD/FMN-containing dehydrogenase